MLKQVSKVTLTSFDPKRALGNGFGTKGVVILGALVGHATGEVRRKSPAGDQEFTGLSGSFEVHRKMLDGTLDEENSSASGVCFIPEAFQNPILDALADKVDGNGKVTQPGADAVNFAFEVGIQKAGNAAGYEWVLQPLVEAAPDQHDPLAELRKALPAVYTQKALAAPEANAKKK